MSALTAYSLEPEFDLNFTIFNPKIKAFCKDVMLSGGRAYLRTVEKLNVTVATDLYVNLFSGNDTAYVALNGVAKREYLPTIWSNGPGFANDISAFVIKEGPTEIAKKYFHAVETDPLVGTILLHVNRVIEQREFNDFSVWLNSKASFDFGPQIGVLTPQSFRNAMPTNPSARLRIMIEAFRDEVLVAS